MARPRETAPQERNSAIASFLIFFTEFIKFHKLNTTSSLYIWSDSVAAIRRVQAIKEDLLKRRPPNIADLLYELVAKLPISTKLDSIRSCQDTGSASPSLSTMAHLNIRADKLAEQFLVSHPKGTNGHLYSNSPHFPPMEVSLLFGKARIHSEVSYRIKSSIQETE